MYSEYVLIVDVGLVLRQRCRLFCWVFSLFSRISSYEEPYKTPTIIHFFSSCVRRIKARPDAQTMTWPRYEYKHGKARHRTALRSAELALRCAAELS